MVEAIGIALGIAMMVLLSAFVIIILGAAMCDAVGDLVGIPSAIAGLLFVAFLAVVTAVVYKARGTEPQPVVCKPPCECLCPEEME